MKFMKNYAMLLIKNSSYENADAISNVINYIKNTAVRIGGYGFYPVNTTEAIKVFTDIKNKSDFSPDRNLWHLMVCFTSQVKFGDISTIAYKIAELFCWKYAVFYGIHLKNIHNNRGGHIHFAIQAIDYNNCDYEKQLTYEKIMTYISAIEQLLLTEYNLHTNIQWKEE